MTIRAIITRGYGSGGSIPFVVTRGYAPGAPIVPPVVPTDTSVAGGFLLRRRKVEDPEEALEIIEAAGTPAQQERAADITPLLYKLEHAKNLLDAEQKRRARAEARWAMECAKRILQDRDDEEVAVALLLLH